MSALPSIPENAATPREAELAGALYEAYSGRILGYCLRRLPNREEAEDAVQHTFMNAYRGLRRGIVPRSEAAWLFKIAENVCRERRRSAWRRNQLELVQDPDGIAGLAVAPQRTHDELAGLADALAELPPNQQRAILLREWQGLSYREIAEQLEVTESAVETLLFRARRSLARKLDRSRGRAWGSIGTAGAWAKSLFGGAAAKVAASAVVVAGIAVATPAVRHDLGGPSSTKTAVASAAVPTPEPRSQSVTQSKPAPAPAKSRATTLRKRHVRGRAPRTPPKRTRPASARPAAQAPPPSHGSPPPPPPPNVQVPPVAPPAPPQLPVQLPIDLPPLPPLPPINVPGGVPPLPPLPPLPLP
jgi:RNA polymerase sigma-70 factor (ECF subfamily)